MPMYDLRCWECGQQKRNQWLTYNDYDAGAFGFCKCGGVMGPLLNAPSTYGLMRCHDQAFADAEEATGCSISSTRDIDRLERSGVIRAVTNPSRARKFVDKK
jgi:hypothetical protein